MPGDQERHDRPLHGQDLPGVPPLRRAQRADRVGHRLDPGQRRAAVGEGPRHDVHGAEGDQPRVRADADRARARATTCGRPPASSRTTPATIITISEPANR